MLFLSVALAAWTAAFVGLLLQLARRILAAWTAAFVGLLLQLARRMLATHAERA